MGLRVLPGGRRPRLTGVPARSAAFRANRGGIDPMDWPVRFPAEMSAGTVSVRCYDPADATELLGSLADERVWEHMSRASPSSAVSLDEVIRSRLADGYRGDLHRPGRRRPRGRHHLGPVRPRTTRPAWRSAERCSPRTRGERASTPDVKRLLLAVIFRHGAQWVQLQVMGGTGGRPPRSASSARRNSASAPSRVVRRDGGAGGAGSSASTGPAYRQEAAQKADLMTPG